MVTTKAGFATYTRVRDIMTHAVQTLDPNSSIATASDLMTRLQVSGMPVAKDNRVVGVLSKSDILRVTNADKTAVHAAMTRSIYAVRTDDPAIVAVKLLVDERLHRLIVVGPHGQLDGIVTPLDVCRALLDHKPIIFDNSEPIAVDYVSLTEMNGTAKVQPSPSPA